MIFWLTRQFANPTIEEILFCLTTSISGTDFNTIFKFIIIVIVPAIIYTCIYFLIFKYLKDEKKQKIYRILLLIFALCEITVMGLYAQKKLNIVGYLKAQKNDSTFIKDNYVKVDYSQIKVPKQKNNLIVIYLESMESTFSSITKGGKYKKNYIPNLTKIAENNISFSDSEKMGGAQVINGLTWTTAGLLGTTAGINIKTTISNVNSLQYSYSNLLTLGDVLEESGYNMMFSLGSNSTFGGIKSYLSSHGAYIIHDYDYYKKNKLFESKDESGWGLTDKKLYALAKDEITALSKEDKPFYYSLMTIDTHSPDGHCSSDCSKKCGDYFDTIECADQRVNNFIEWLKKQDYYKNTTIVILGDHLSMSTSVKLENSERRVYNAFINSVVKKNNTTNRTFTNMDIYPTILASLGYELPDDKIALGTNLFSDKRTLAEEYGFYDFYNNMSATSSFYNKYILKWGRIIYFAFLNCLKSVKIKIGEKNVKRKKWNYSNT